MDPALMIDCTPLHKGGGVQVAIALLDALSRTGRRWIAAIPSVMTEQLPDHLRGHPNLIIFPKRGPKDFVLLYFRLARLEAAFRPDMVFTVFGPAYFKARAPHLVGFALPTLVYPPEPHWPKPGVRARLSDRLKTIMMKRSDQIVVETEAFRRRTADAIGVPVGKIHVIGNAVNPIMERYPPCPINRTGRVQILIPSAWYPHKNLESVITVAAHLRRQAPGLDACFQFTLPPRSDGWQRLHSAACAAGIDANIATLGTLTLDQLAIAYQNAQLVYLPTLREASTAVYPEAFHFQRPLITTDIDFARELCGDAALFVNPDRAAETAATIAALLTDPAQQQLLVDAGLRQLSRGYPTTDEKFQAQLALMDQVAARR